MAHDDGRRIVQLIAELRRRKVFRVAAVYGALGFGLMQVADVMFPRVGLPDWTVTLIVWLILLGFPIAVVHRRDDLARHPPGCEPRGELADPLVDGPHAVRVGTTGGSARDL